MKLINDIILPKPKKSLFGQQDSPNQVVFDYIVREKNALTLRIMVSLLGFGASKLFLLTNSARLMEDMLLMMLWPVM